VAARQEARLRRSIPILPVDAANLSAGSHRLTESIELDRGGDSFTGTGTSQQFDNQG
jgi:hypothetical protein